MINFVVGDVHPMFDAANQEWVAELNGREFTAGCVRELKRKLPRGTSILDYYPDGYHARRSSRAHEIIPPLEPVVEAAPPPPAPAVIPDAPPLEPVVELIAPLVEPVAVIPAVLLSASEPPKPREHYHLVRPYRERAADLYPRRKW